MIRRIHILGASGSGTTTLGKVLSERLGYYHFDTDDFYWEDTKEPFTIKREMKDRQALLKEALDQKESWVLSGSLCGWGDLFIPLFDLVIFVYTPEKVRIQRLIEREIERYGKEVEEHGTRRQDHLEFIEWARQYDHAGLKLRSLSLHEDWLSKINRPILRVEGDHSVLERVEIVMDYISQY